MIQMIQLILYDLDGTLIDSRRDIADAVNGTLQELGFRELSIERVSSFVGNGVTNLMRQVLEDATRKTAGAPLAGALKRAGTCLAGRQARPAPTQLGRSIRLFRRRYGGHLLDHTCLYPSVRKVLEFFKNRKQAVLTNKPQEFTFEILRGLGIDSYFFQIVGGDQRFRKKPDPEAVFEILNAAGVSPAEAVFVGDSATDVETGRNAGVRTIAVTYGFGKREEIESSRPDFIVEDLTELMECRPLKI